MTLLEAYFHASFPRMGIFSPFLAFSMKLFSTSKKKILLIKVDTPVFSVKILEYYGFT